jgi:hypothetical protein
MSNSEKIWKIQKKIVKRYEKYGKYGRKVFFFFYKTINSACNLFMLTLCPTVRGNNSVSEEVNVIGDITLYVGNKLQLCMCKDNIKVGGITL